MYNLILTVLASTPSPSSTTAPEDTFYSPGTIGFLAVFGVTVGAIVLIFDMVRRVRRVRYRAEINAKLDAEQTSPAKGSAAKAAQAKSSAPKASVAKKTPAKPAAPTKPSRPAPPAKPKRD